MAPAEEDLWQVVGGVGRGGILVRTSKELASPKEAVRLGEGSLIRALEHDGENARLRYELVEGSGPQQGWVTTRLSDKALVERRPARPQCDEPAAKPRRWSALAEERKGQAIPEPQQEPAAAAEVAEEKQVAPPVQPAPAAAQPQRQEQLEAAPRPSQQARLPAFLRAQQAAAAPKRLPSRFLLARSTPGSLPAQTPSTRLLAGPSAAATKRSSAPQGPNFRSLLKTREDWQEAPRRRFLHLRGPKGASALEAAKLPEQKGLRSGGRPGPARLLGALNRKPPGMGVVPGLQSPLFPLFADKLLPSARPSNRFLMSCKPAGKEDPEEELQLCPWCNLPIGYWGYGADDDRYDKNALLHGECKAQLILQKLQDEDLAKRREESKSREQSRKDFGIGWEVEQIPRNNALAGYLQCSVAPQGTCCVAVEEESHKLQLLPATDPATSINLEYLAVALQVRKKEGREPLFSLDPEDECRGAAFIKDMMQDKRYEPAWLAGTSAGEVMFQADYHLKELSMGAFEQPIVGLKSCFDYSELEGDDSPWRAREWFVVKKAEILMTQDGVLIPAVEMGVEAREQCLGPHGREDARITRPDHPLVKYAERFSHFFDLIAERKSVIFHLRELAKASTLAKFLIEDGFELPDEWFNLASEAEPSEDNMKIPQLWNELCVSKIQLRNGLIVDAEKGLFSSTHGVYGGVQFGLDRLPQVSPTRISAFARRGIRAAATITASSSHVPFGWGASPGVAQPRGVDLNLDRFDLSETKPADEAPANGWAHDQLELALGGTSFLEGLKKVEDSPFKQEDRDLLQAIFNPLLSDRQSEGSLFIPPDARQEYADRLKGLLAEEEEVRQQRMQHFLSKGFSMDDAGPLFPSSWTASLAIARERAPWSGCSKHDEGRQPTASEEALIAKQLTSSAPLFDRSAEDGLRFRIYQVGSLEVRTTQPQGGSEVVGIVFKRLAVNTDVPKDRRILDTDKVVKITEYVEANKEQKFAYFVVLEAENGAVMVTEKLHNGAVVWLEHPTDLESRTSFAKVTGCTACSERDVTVGAVKGFKNDEVQRSGYSASRKECQKYAQAIYAQAAPVWERRWEQLSTSQRGWVRDLGICSPSIWNEGNSRVFSLAWGALRDAQKEAAQALGIRESDWGEWFRKSQEAPKEEGPATEKGAEAEEEEEDSGVTCPRTCPKGHSLKRFKVDAQETEEDGGFECDGCDKCCFGGSVMWGCQKCDYDLCVKCAFVDPSIELTGGGGKSEDGSEDEDEEGEEDEAEQSEDEIMEATAVFGSAKAAGEPDGTADDVAEDSSAEPADSLEEVEDDEGEEVQCD